MRRERLCEPDILVWPDLRQEPLGTITNLRFRLGANSDAIKVDTTAWETHLFAILKWHGCECFFRQAICNQRGNEPMLGASDADLAVILEVLVLDPRMSAWIHFAEAELDARLNESNHRRLMRLLAQRAWSKAREQES